MEKLRTLNWTLHAVGLLLLTATAGSYYAFMYRPLQARLAADVQHSSQLEELLNESKSVFSEHRSLHEQLAALRESLEATHSRVPADLKQEEFLDEVRAIANEADLALIDFRFGASESLANYSKGEVALQCSGSFGSIARFLHGVDHLARITEIANLTLESDTNFDRYPLQITFVLYYGAHSHDREKRGGVL